MSFSLKLSEQQKKKKTCLAFEAEYYTVTLPLKTDNSIHLMVEQGDEWDVIDSVFIDYT